MTDHEDIRKALDALNETEFTARCHAVDHLTRHAPQWLAGLLAECDGLRARVAMLDSLLAPLQAAAQHAVADLDFALVGMRLADALPLMREAHDEALARAELAETKHASCEAHLRLVTEERERLADQREDWRARSIANEERAEAAERERDDALRDVEHIHARASRAESDRAEVAKERASLLAENARLREEVEARPAITAEDARTFSALGCYVHSPGDQGIPACGRIGSALRAHASQPKGDDTSRIYPCDRCGKMRTKAEGGTTFTVCDACWDLKPKGDGGSDV